MGCHCSIVAVAIWFLAGVCLCVLGKSGTDEEDQMTGGDVGVHEEVFEKDAEEQAVEEVAYEMVVRSLEQHSWMSSKKSGNL